MQQNTEEHAKVACYVMVAFKSSMLCLGGIQVACYAMVAFKSAIMTRVARGSKCVILLVKHEAGVDWSGM